MKKKKSTAGERMIANAKRALAFAKGEEVHIREAFQAGGMSEDEEAALFEEAREEVSQEQKNKER